ncbi:MAG: T9SS type A sorting domain-containing protein [Bacteroidales bacterium]|nr:T9SS type A sorting domain-containing protein [Bacteroidales bacterium]
MRKILLSFFCLIFSGVLVAQQDTIVAFTFPTGELVTDTLPDAGLSGNLGYSIRAEGGTSAIEMKNGATTFAAQATGWDSGADTKFWSIKFKAAGYANLKVYSKMEAGGANPGPRDWKVQYKRSSTDWADVPGGTITAANDWTTGVVNGITLPSDCDNPGSESIYVRWIMTSNTDINGDDVLSTGKFKIDDIVVLASTYVEPDTITGWSFPNPDDIELNANMGLSGNLGYDIRAEDTSFNQRTISLTNGADGTGDYAATAEGWDEGANNKAWSIKFKANGYSNMKVSSKQRSGDTNPGPKDFKIQCQLSGQPWIDVVGGNVTVANDWTTGVVDRLALPSEIDLPGSTSIYIRWIMTSNDDIMGGTVASTGTSKIDDILVIGEASGSGIETIIYADKLNVYPNPSNDIINVESEDEIVLIQVYNLMGAKILDYKVNSTFSSLDVSELTNGMYILRAFYKNERQAATRRIIVE